MECTSYATYTNRYSQFTRGGQLLLKLMLGVMLIWRLSELDTGIRTNNAKSHSPLKPPSNSFFILQKPRPPLRIDCSCTPSRKRRRSRTRKDNPSVSNRSHSRSTSSRQNASRGSRRSELPPYPIAAKKRTSTTTTTTKKKKKKKTL